MSMPGFEPVTSVMLTTTPQQAGFCDFIMVEYNFKSSFSYQLTHSKDNQLDKGLMSVDEMITGARFMAFGNVTQFIKEQQLKFYSITRGPPLRNFTSKLPVIDGFNNLLFNCRVPAILKQ